MFNRTYYDVILRAGLSFFILEQHGRDMFQIMLATIILMKNMIHSGGGVNRMELLYQKRVIILDLEIQQLDPLRSLHGLVT